MKSFFNLLYVTTISAQPNNKFSSYSIMELCWSIPSGIPRNRAVVLVTGPATHTWRIWACLEGSVQSRGNWYQTQRKAFQLKRPERSAYFRKQWFIEIASCSQANLPPSGLQPGLALWHLFSNFLIKGHIKCQLTICFLIKSWFFSFFRNCI